MRKPKHTGLSEETSEGLQPKRLSSFVISATFVPFLLAGCWRSPALNGVPQLLLSQSAEAVHEGTLEREIGDVALHAHLSHSPPTTPSAPLTGTGDDHQMPLRNLTHIDVLTKP